MFYGNSYMSKLYWYFKKMTEGVRVLFLPQQTSVKRSHQYFNQGKFDNSSIQSGFTFS